VGVDIEAIDSLAAFSARVPTVESPDFAADQADDPPLGRRHAHLLSPGVPYTVFITGQCVEVHPQSIDDMKGGGADVDILGRPDVDFTTEAQRHRGTEAQR